MSFVNPTVEGQVYAPGYFLAHEECVRKTVEVPQSMGTTMPDGSKLVKGGIPFPANDGTAVGILYEDVDVTSGNMPGSLVKRGVVIEDRLTVELESTAKTALEGLGFVFVTEAEVTRPDDGRNAGGGNG